MEFFSPRVPLIVAPDNMQLTEQSLFVCAI